MADFYETHSRRRADAPPRAAGLLSTAAAALWERERDRFALWAPIAIGLGVWAFFSLPSEPAPMLGWIAAGLAAACAAARSACVRPWTRLALAALALTSLGVASASWRVWSAAAPVLAQPTTAAIEGRIVAVERRGAARWRITVDRLAGADAVAALHRVRVDAPAPAAARDDLRARETWIGARARLDARLRPPSGPTEPDGADFRLRSWMAGLGATGVARSPPHKLADAAPGGAADALWLAVERLRIRIAARAIAATRSADGAASVEGAVIAALLVGDRSGLDAETVAALRDSNLAHLLAISGLHMGIVCLTVFALARLALAVAPETPWGVDPKKAAALCALTAGAAYLALSGAAVSTERAYWMAVVAFGAVLANRPVVTLRAVAVAATVILLWRPESLFAPGFQLSFAATAAMVAAFEALRSSTLLTRRYAEEGPDAGAAAPGGVVRRVVAAAADRPAARWLGALIVSASVAGAATAPFAAETFNRLANYGLLANLAAAPAMGLFVMPLGLAGALLAPFGLDAPAFQGMALGVGYVVFIAEAVAALPNATRTVASGGAAALGLIVIGGLWLCLWRGVLLRSVGLAFIAAGALVWAAAARPDILIGPRGALVGVATPLGRAIDRADAEAFVARRWLQRDGDRATPSEAATRPGFGRYRGGATAIGPERWRVETILGRTVSLGRIRFRCRGGALLIAPLATTSIDPADPRAPDRSADGVVWRFSPERWCLVFDRAALRRSAPIAIAVSAPPPEALNVDDAPPSLADIPGLDSRTAAAFGARLWTDAAVRASHQSTVEKAPASSARRGASDDQ